MSKAILGQIERNESGPTVVTLQKIATGLNVPFSTLIVPDASATPSAFDSQQQAMVVTPAFPWDPELRFDHFSIALAPGALSESTPHEEGVTEHVVVINGALDLCLQGEWHLLQPGEGWYFVGDEVHAYRNRGVQTAYFHSLIHYPKEKTVGESATRQDDR